jgi:hypothetical protein
MSDKQNSSESTDGQRLFIKRQYDWKDEAKNHVKGKGLPQKAEMAQGVPGSL